MKRLVMIMALSLLGCGGAGSATSSTTTAASSDPPAPATEPIEGAESFFAERGLEGAFVLRRNEPGAPYRAIGDVDRRDVPASTFKIPNTLIGLETGVIPDASFTLEWDGVERQFPAWNRDHDLRGAINESVVWWYQELARRVGYERMGELVRAMRFGDANIGGEEVIDRFWLDGPLGISPREQVDFLARLTSGELPVSPRSVAILRDVMPSEEHGETTVRFKTGTFWMTGQDVPVHAWLVGWVEQGGEERAHFALILRSDDPDRLSTLMEARRPLLAELLAREGLL